MDESFKISVFLNKQDYSFNARLVTIGYSHKFIVLINGIEVIYEPDEERHYRAILQVAQQTYIRGNDIDLIKAVANEIESIL